MNEIAEIEPGIFRLKTDRMDLRLEAKKPPLLVGGKGHITVCGRESYYHSLTDIEATGMVRGEDGWVAVEGRAWMDHQWADESYRKDKWTWFSVKLDDGADIMVVEYDDGRRKEYIASVMDARGRASHFGEAILTPSGEPWQSAQTNAKYPMAWKISIPHAGIELRTESLMRDQEMVFGTINYWEGPIAIRGMVGGKRVRGSGFMELVGYPADYNPFVLAGRELNRRILDFFK